MNIASFLAQNIQGYNVTDLAKWVSYQSMISQYYGQLTPALILTQWGLESRWGGANISTYYNLANQASGCGCGSICVHQPNGLSAFSSIKDGVKAYSALIIHGYPHVMWAFSANGNGTNGFKAAAKALGQGYYVGYNGGTITFCGGPYTLASSSGARIWATSQYGSPAGNDFIGTFNANSNLQALNYAVTTNPLPEF